MSAATRAYVPLTRAHLADLHAGRAIQPGVPAFCVTDDMRSRNPASDEEELEFISLQQAAGHAIAGGDPAIVAAVDLPETAVDHAGALPFVTKDDLTTREVVSFHLSDDAVDGSRAPTVEGTADVESTPAAGLVEPQTAVALSWFDITELSQLLRR